MRKLPEVEYAKALMTEAQDWSIWRWLLEKKKVRQAADDANAALAAAEAEVKAGWSGELKKAYARLAARDAAARTRKETDSETMQVATRIKDADDEAERVRLDAEATFDEADRRLSASLAKEGTHKAIKAWTLRGRAIRKAEAARGGSRPAGEK